MKIVTIVGARPQFIKAAVISREFKQNRTDINEIIIHTGQHYDKSMSDIFFKQLHIPQPNYNLKIGGGSHGENTGRMIEKIEEILLVEKPDYLLVYGDTDSTLAGALAASKLQIPIIHIEAGLRSYNRKMPEEINRVLTDHISNLLFCPSNKSYHNLINEGIDKDKIFIVGDIMLDAFNIFINYAQKPIWWDSINLPLNEYVLCTIHRAENTNHINNLTNIFNGLGNSKLPILLPMHPRTKNIISNLNITIPNNIFIVEPVGYLEMIWLEKNCKIIATDSGGVQKEAFFNKKPCITLREETEWVELVEMGYNKITGTDSDLICDALLNINFSNFEELIYGDGNTAIKISCQLK
jgi:UDP-GlcNAc3NAcA epimerase